MDETEPISLSDLKSAYMLAFVVLGYSWALSSRLGPVREAIAVGGSPSEHDAVLTCGFSPRGESADRRLLEIVSPAPMLAVVGPEGAVTVGLPLAATGSVRDTMLYLSNQTVVVREYGWPLMVIETARNLGRVEECGKPEDFWDSGVLFHLDRCRDSHDRLSVAKHRALVRSVNIRFAGTQGR